MDREERKARIVGILSEHTTEMEGYAYFGSNPGVPEDRYEDIANEILAIFTPVPHDRHFGLGLCGTCGTPIRAHDMYGTVCDCARPEVP